MKNIPLGKGAISIGRPSHELRLYGFMEKAKPILFVLTDGSGKNNPSMRDYMRVLLPPAYSNMKESFYDIAMQDKESDKKFNIQNIHVYQALLSGNIEFFDYYTRFIAGLMINKKIDYVIADPIEGKDVINDMCRVMTDMAIQLVYKVKKKQIMNYEYSLTTSYNDGITEDSIHVELEDEICDHKLNAVASYPFSILKSFKPNFSIDENIIIQLKQTPEGLEVIKKILDSLNPQFFRNEYVRPYTYNELSGTPAYEAEGEKLVKEGIYTEVIRYEDHVKPIVDKLRKMVIAYQAS